LKVVEGIYLLLLVLWRLRLCEGVSEGVSFRLLTDRRRYPKRRILRQSRKTREAN
jgi:hypothetical protein